MCGYVSVLIWINTFPIPKRIHQYCKDGWGHVGTHNSSFQNLPALNEMETDWKKIGKRWKQMERDWKDIWKRLEKDWKEMETDGKRLERYLKEIGKRLESDGQSIRRVIRCYKHVVFLEQLRIRPSNWKLFELDLDCQVLSTKSTEAIPDTVKLNETMYLCMHECIWYNQRKFSGRNFRVTDF